ncbi:acyltransferase family protein [Corallococcus carmarthensis]|uniref:acyltransferase family protein n=1 Tax=Corallococcus carmarthensis TaxID=2316728 RepID=UPI00148D1364|nr:acyltransferase [Corallococcus carmarthensis]NOK20483.1 acyltransferase [Corallococcus carmarthensis]
MKQQSGGSLDALTGLRFLAALHVVLFHFGTACIQGVAPEWMVQVVASGYASVGVFFVLSGFVLAYNYMDTAGGMQTPPRAFWSARLARVYPVFLLMFMLSAVPTAQGSLAANSVPVSVAKLSTAGLTTLLMLQSWVPKLALYWNPPSWSVSVEAFFYAVFPALAGRLERFRGARMTAALVGVWILGLLPPVLYLVLRPDGPGPLSVATGGTWMAVLKFNPLVRLPEFLLGVLLGLVFVRERAAAASRAPRSGAVMALAGAALLLLGFSQGAWIPYPLMHNALLAPASALLVYGLARGGGPLGLVLARPWLVHLGGASYALYLLQYPVSEGVHWMERFVDLTSPTRFLAVLLVVLVPASVAVHRWVETPWRSRVKRGLQPWVDGTPARPAPAPVVPGA